MKLKPTENKADVNDPLYEEQVVHTPMGTTMKPTKFVLGDVVVTKETVGANNVEIPKNVKLTVISTLGDDMYTLTGPNNLIVELNGSSLEKSEGGTVWGNL